MTSHQKRKLTEGLFLAPTILAFLVVQIIPFIYGIYYSFTDWAGTGAATKMVGFENYVKIFQDKGFMHSFLITLEFTVLNVVAVNVVAFLISLLVTSEIRGRNVYRAGFFVPNLIGGIVLGSIWQFIFSSILPSVGQALNIAGLSKSLITNTNTVMFTMVTVNTWQYAGYIMLIFVAAIQGIPKSVMEAAEVDGAPYWRRIRSIQIPLMANSFTISLFLTLLFYLFFAAETVVGLTQIDQFMRIFTVDARSHTVGLHIGSVISADIRSFIMRKGTLFQCLVDDIDGTFDQSSLVGVLDPEYEITVIFFGDQIGIESCSEIADMHIAGRRRCESCSDFIHSISPFVHFSRTLRIKLANIPKLR